MRSKLPARVWQSVEKIKRGKHTTRVAELIPYEAGGYIVDTPGFSAVDFTGLEPESLSAYFPEFAPYENTCRFNGCCHIHEPECKVKEALEAGLISRLRYDDYVLFFEEIAQMKKW